MVQAQLTLWKSTLKEEPIYCINGQPIQDPHDPRRGPTAEITKTLSDVATKNCLVYGFDFGYTADAILELKPEANVIIYEPNPTICNISSDYRKDLLKHPRVTIIKEVTELDYVLLRLYKRGDPVHVTIVANWNVLFPEEFEVFNMRVRNILENINISEHSKDIRYQKWCDNLIHNLPSHINNTNIKDLFFKFGNIPAVICAAGPSLSKNLGQLKRLQDKIIIIAVNTSYAALVDAGIIPHFVLAIESYNVKTMFTGLPINTTTLVSSLVAHPDLQDLDFKHKITFAQNTSFYEEWMQKNLQEPYTFDMGGSVACGAFAFGLHMGCNPIITIGQDLAFTDGKMYSKGTKYDGLKLDLDTEKGFYTFEQKKDILKDSNVAANTEQESKRRIKYIKGYYGGMVPTNDHFTFFLSWFESAARLVKKQGHPLVFINATEGGAYIEGFKHIPLKKALKGLKHRPNHNARAIIARAKPLIGSKIIMLRELKRLDTIFKDETKSIEDLRDLSPLFQAYTRKTVREENETKLQEELQEFKDLLTWGISAVEIID